MFVGADITWKGSQRLSQPRAGNGGVLAKPILVQWVLPHPTLPVHRIRDPGSLLLVGSPPVLNVSPATDQQSDPECDCMGLVASLLSLLISSSPVRVILVKGQC